MQKPTLVSSIRRNLRQDPAPSPAAASGGTAFEAVEAVAVNTVLAALGEPRRLEDGLAETRVHEVLVSVLLELILRVFLSCLMSFEIALATIPGLR